MERLKEMEILIYEIRQALNIIIEEKCNLLDVEVIAISQKLDGFLNKYNSLLVEKVNSITLWIRNFIN